MRCTDCSHAIKPVVAIDIDGTMGDYHTHFLQFAEEYLGRTARWTYHGTSQFRDWFCLMYHVDRRTWEDIKLAYRQGAQKRSMPMYRGAEILCAAVQDAGAELWLTTTRPYLRLDNVDPDTRAWLERHCIQFDHMLYDEHKYRVLAERVDRVRVVAVLDDLQEQLDWAKHAFGSDVPIMRGTVWNRDVKIDCPRALSLKEAQEIILSRIYQWKGTHE
jgi:hypothetical protein